MDMSCNQGEKKKKNQFKSYSHAIGFIMQPNFRSILLTNLSSLSVYSAWDVGKSQCFTWIRERFSGPNVQFCVIGDGWEECEAAEAMGWPFVKIDPCSSKYHRFPGLTPKDLDLYLSVVYENRNDEKSKEDLKSPVEP